VFWFLDREVVPVAAFGDARVGSFAPAGGDAFQDLVIAWAFAWLVVSGGKSRLGDNLAADDIESSQER
jgi:hypothetical protein